LPTRFLFADHGNSFQSAINDWQSAILRDILAAFGEVAEWLKAALC
jgi:hypothetical protein